MWCLSIHLTSWKSWIQLIKGVRRSKYSSHCEPKPDEDLESFDYSIVPLHDYDQSLLAEEKNYGSIAPRTLKTIRLLRILPTTSDGLLECHVRTVKLDGPQTPSYDALSYTWGPTTRDEFKKGVNAKRRHNILCNGRPLPVTENLLNCLTQLKRGHYDREIWVDAICINQANQAERSEQVSIMADIYLSAECVHVWLGPSDASTKLAHKLVGRLSKLSEEDLRTIVPQSYEYKHNTDLLGRANSRESWESIFSLFERSWFTRAWVVQELVLARKTTVLCGDYVFDWEAIVSVSGVMAKQTSANKSRKQLSYKNPAKLAAVKRDILDGKGDILLSSLIRCRTYKASNAHDKVFSLLSLARHQGHNHHTLYPRYESSVSDVYTDVAKYILEVSDDLHVLAHAEGSEFRLVPGLPSWVPDWSVEKDLGLRITGYTRYQAAGQLPCFKEIRDGKILALRGFEFDTISRTGESKEEVNRNGSCDDWLELRNELEQEYPDRDHKDTFWRTLVLDTGRHGAVPITDPWEGSFELWMGLCAHELSDDEKRRAIEFENSFTHSLNLRLFRTANGNLGCGSLSCEKGDSIWIVQGSRVPLILRPTSGEGETTYTLVGGTYLHGFMQGEALDGREFKEIILV
ncbi:HET-domain-containing protein [Jackrogersella minutella]|nr:HET-domain-containing protein [Jackrogersella minutella]